MKVVVCQNCGAKYQLDDDEDLEGFECSICTGNLEKLEEYTTTGESKRKQTNSNQNFKDSKLVFCEDCGLKYVLGKNDNVNEYECVSCGGKLKLVSGEEELAPAPQPTEPYLYEKTATTPGKRHDINKLKKDLDQSKNELIEKKSKTPKPSISTKPKTSTPEKHGKNEEYQSQYAENILKKSVRVGPKGKISDELTDYLNKTEKQVSQPKPQPKTNTQEKSKKQPRPTRNIENDRYELALYNYHDELKKQMKQDYLEGIKEASLGDSSFEKFKNLIKEEFRGYKNDLTHNPKLIHTDIRTPNGYQTNRQELIPHPNEENLSYHALYIVVGSIIAIIGLADVLISNRVGSILFIMIGIIIIIVGFYKRYSYADNEARGRIIRAKLLTLPEEYYVLYYVRPPESNKGINHVVIGPTGIYTIVSQKYTSKEDKVSIKQDKENVRLIGSTGSLEEYLANKNSLKIVSNFRDKQTHFQVKDEKIKFDTNNKIKQETLILNEKLSQFLDDNGLRGIHIEPLVGFVNNEVAVINVVLTNEDLFLEELLYKITHSERKIDELTIHKCAVLLSQYSAECSS